MSTLAARLAAPSRVLSLEDLAREWTAARVTVRIGGYGVLAHDLVLLRRVRGGLGRVLMRSASAEALAGRPCPWDPPCGLDVLFREQGRTGPDGIPKPFVLGASRLGPDLIVTLTLFGLAIDWVPAVTSALVDTLKNGIDWRGQREGLYLPEPAVSDVWVRGVPGPVVPPVAVAARLTFLTPMNSEGDDPRERPATIVARLARRAEGLARWHDAAIGEDWRALGEVWASLDYDAGGLHAGDRKSVV